MIKTVDSLSRETSNLRLFGAVEAMGVAMLATARYEWKEGIEEESDTAEDPQAHERDDEGREGAEATIITSCPILKFLAVGAMSLIQCHNLS